MKIKIYQGVLLLVFVSTLVCGYLLADHILNLPFRPTNDELHRMDSAVALDFLIPAGTYLDEKMTIREVVKIKIDQAAPRYRRAASFLSDTIPLRYRSVANLVLFLFWSFLFITFLRLFTFLGYARALRYSLLLGGASYYFMPDFSPGIVDDTIFFLLPLSIFLFRFYVNRRKKRSIMEKNAAATGDIPS